MEIERSLDAAEQKIFRELAKGELRIFERPNHCSRVQTMKSAENLSERNLSVRTRKNIVLSPRDDKLTQSISRLRSEKARSQRKKVRKLMIESELLAVDLFLKEQEEEALRILAAEEKKAQIRIS